MNKITTTTTTSGTRPTSNHRQTVWVQNAVRQLRRQAMDVYLEKPLTEAFKEDLRRRAEELRGAMSPARGPGDRQAIGAIVGMVLGMFNDRRPAQQTVAAYVLQLEPLPLWAIREACDDISRGQVPELSPDFPPTATRIYQVADAKLAPLRDEARDLKLLLTAKTAETVEQTAAAKERLGEKFAALSAELKTLDEPRSEADRQRRRKNDEERQKRHTHELLRDYQAAGLNPRYAGSIPLSLSLLRSNEEYLKALARIGERSREDP